MLPSQRGGDWVDLYAFSLEPRYSVDFEVANDDTSTHPDSPFVHRLFVPIPTLAASTLLFGRELRVGRGAEVVSRMIKDDEELLRVLAETFGLDFPPITRVVGVKGEGVLCRRKPAFREQTEKSNALRYPSLQECVICSKKRTDRCLRR